MPLPLKVLFSLKIKIITNQSMYAKLLNKNNRIGKFFDCTNKVT